MNDNYPIDMIQEVIDNTIEHKMWNIDDDMKDKIFWKVLKLIFIYDYELNAKTVEMGRDMSIP